jgi:hypothetical protein
MDTGLKILSIFLTVIISIALFFGVTKSTNFLDLPIEKRQIGIKRIKIGLFISTVIGIYNILNL